MTTRSGRKATATSADVTSFVIDLTEGAMDTALLDPGNVPTLDAAHQATLDRAPAFDLSIDDNTPVDAVGRGVVKASGTELVDVKLSPRHGWSSITQALRFGPGSSFLRLSLGDALDPQSPFTAEVLVRPTKGGKRMNLLEGQQVPFALMLLADGGRYVAAASVRAGDTWVEARSTRAVPVGRWTLVSCAFTGDDLLLLVGGEIAGRVSVTESLRSAGKRDVTAGASVDGKRHQLRGDIAGLRIWNGVPAGSPVLGSPGNYQALVADAEIRGVGAITARAVVTGPGPGVAVRSRIVEREIGRGLVGTFLNGQVFWSEEWGSHELRGPILARYLAVGGPTGVLGFPRTDEVAGRRRGSKVVYFENGAIFWSSATGAHEVTGRIYYRFLDLGGDGSWLGLPTNNPARQGGGNWQRFQGATIYDGPGTDAFEVHGAIRDRYHGLGGAGGFLGFPLSNETDVHDRAGRVIGKMSRFQHGTIYWSRSTGAFEVHGAIRLEYERMGGPASKLGFPLTNETRTSGRGTETRYNDFQGGIIVWRGGLGARAITNLSYHIGMVTSGSIDDGIKFIGKDRTAELVTYTTIQANGSTIENRKRRPSGHAGSSHNINRRFSVNRIRRTTRVHIKIDVDDWDRASSNDWIGTLDRTFDIHDWWGLLGGSPRGIYSNLPATSKSGDAPRLDTLQFDLSVGDQSGLDPSKPYRQQYFWRWDNFSTAELTHRQYSDTFRDVEHLDTTWDKVLSPFDYAFYELAYKKIAAKGNCFGISLESVNARAGASVFMEPIHQHVGTRGDVVDTTASNVIASVKSIMNEKHGYQLGASSINWLIGRLINLEAVRPLRVYQQVKSHLSRGDWPVLCMIDIGDGRGHCVVPYRTEDRPGSEPHRIYVADPNVAWRPGRPNDPTFIEVRKDDTFRFRGGTSTYQSTRIVGGMLPGTLLVAYPYHRLNTIPRTPFWEVLMAIAALLGFVLLIAGDGEGAQIAVDGRNYYEGTKGTRALNAGKIKPGAAGAMARIPLLDAIDGPLPEVYAGRGMVSSVQTELRGIANGQASQRLFTTRAATVYETAAKTGMRDELMVTGLNTGKVILDAKTTQADKAANVQLTRFLSVAPVDKRKPANYVTATTSLTMGRAKELTVGFERGNAVFVKGPQANEQVTMEIASHIDGKQSRGRVSMRAEAAGEVLRVSPADLSDVGSRIVVERLSHVDGPVLGRIVPTVD